MNIQKNAIKRVKASDKFGCWLTTYFVCDWCATRQVHVIEIGPDDEIPIYVACSHCDHLNTITAPKDD